MAPTRVREGPGFGWTLSSSPGAGAALKAICIPGFGMPLPNSIQLSPPAPASGFCELGALWQNLENAGMKAALGLPKSLTGVLITKTEPLAPASKVRSDLIDRQLTVLLLAGCMSKAHAAERTPPPSYPTARPGLAPGRRPDAP
jgi:hypothetical protein